jgi:predicted nucleotidyltransferase/DNA-binding transcriptional ArsR family regulator
MASVLTEPVASTIVVLDDTGGATLSEIARAAGKPVSTIQRAVDRLLESGLIRRESSRGQLTFAFDAPREALRELADWRLGRPRRFVPVRDDRTRPDAQGQARDVSGLPFPRALAAAIDSIVSKYQPARVILFGSRARGDAGEDSDVDLLVVFDEVSDRRERAVDIARLLRAAPFAKDILVASASDISRPTAGTALAEAVHEGRVIYER